MTHQQFRHLNNKLYFTVEDAAALLGIKRASARVVCSRYVRSGRFIRLKNNFYVTDENWRNFGRKRFYELANYLQVPSYISFLTALSHYEITTQIPRDFYESASLKRSIIYEPEPVTFSYHKIKRECYFGYVKQGSYFIASAEKALVDALYLYSFGKYGLDIDALDTGKLDRRKIRRIIGVFPRKTRKLVERVCGI